MKKVLKCFGVIFILLVIYIVYEIIHLRLYLGDKPLQVEELTKEEKIEDFEYLTKLVEEVYPFADKLNQVKGLDNMNDKKEEFLLKAKETKNNEEFLTLFLSYLEGLRQAGHGGIQLNKEYNFYTAFSFNLPKESFLKSDYWLGLLSKIDYYVHSELKVLYLQGKYYLDETYNNEDIKVPIHSYINSIDGTPIDDYVHALQYYQSLQYDQKLNKVYSRDVFQSNINKDKNTWDVEFVTPEGNVLHASIRKLAGYLLENYMPDQPIIYLFKSLIKRLPIYILIPLRPLIYRKMEIDLRISSYKQRVNINV
jgi:hypothetical protein